MQVCCATPSILNIVNFHVYAITMLCHVLLWDLMLDQAVYLFCHYVFICLFKKYVIYSHIGPKLMGIHGLKIDTINTAVSRDRSSDTVVFLTSDTIHKIYFSLPTQYKKYF